MADTYTIQFRRGMYADFDTSKIRPGEPVAILGNDPSVPSGKALYIAFAVNDVRRLCSIEDISEMVDAGEFVGPQGPKGEKGDKGADGTVAFELLTPEQKESLRGISIKSASVDTDGNLTITFSDGDSEDVGNIMGPQGIPGPKGDKGDVGPQGPKGDKGDVGSKGDNMSDEQAAQIEQNKKDVASLKEDISNKITKFYASSQGETHLADSDNGKIMDMMVYGKSEQKQYSGKNLLNATLQTTTQNGITCTANGDGTYTLNGKLSSDTIFALFSGSLSIDNKSKIILMKNDTFADLGIVSSYCAFKISSSWDDAINYPTIKEIPSGKIVQTINLVLRLSNGGAPVTLTNVLIKPMIVDASLYSDTTYDDFEPYTGGIPSPNPDYPQEIKSVVNPTVKVTNEDGLKVQSITLNNITLNAIPVSSGGNVTINGQQYIADYVDVERGKLVRKIKEISKDPIVLVQPTNNPSKKRFILGNNFLKAADNFNKWSCKCSNLQTLGVGTSASYGCVESCGIDTGGKLFVYYEETSGFTTAEEFKAWWGKRDIQLMGILETPIEIDLTPEEIAASKALATYYPVTNISINSEQLDGYTVFNYPISMANGWNYVKQQIGDTRDYIYDMDARTQDTDLQAAEAYVNSEYAVALTELEV